MSTPAANTGKSNRAAPKPGNDSNDADLQAQRDTLAKEQAAARDDSTTLPHEKDTSRTAALRK